MNLQDRIAVANARYRRSQSADRWVDHRPGAIVPVETILQPLMRRRRNVTRLTSPRKITDGASRYCLVAQEQDSEGELETKLYKVNIFNLCFHYLGISILSSFINVLIKKISNF